jgi:hypothetical protein
VVERSRELPRRSEEAIVMMDKEKLELEKNNESYVKEARRSAAIEKSVQQRKGSCETMGNRQWVD